MFLDAGAGNDVVEIDTLAADNVFAQFGAGNDSLSIAGVVAAIMAMNHNFLPPTINCDEPDPECDLNYIPNRGIARPVDISLCNCIGFGSKNSALVIARGEM